MSPPQPPHPHPLASRAHTLRPCASPSTPPGAPRSRVEYFVFSLLAEMRGHRVQLYAMRDGKLVLEKGDAGHGHTKRVFMGFEVGGGDGASEA